MSVAGGGGGGGGGFGGFDRTSPQKVKVRLCGSMVQVPTALRGD